MEIIPPKLVQFCSLGKFTDGKLGIIVGNGSVAAKLKQTLPSLISKFHKSGFIEVTAIQITVQANYYTCHADHSPNRKLQISNVGAENLSQFAANLPHSPLKTAVTSMIKKSNQQKKLNRTVK